MGTARPRSAGAPTYVRAESLGAGSWELGAWELGELGAGARGGRELTAGGRLARSRAWRHRPAGSGPHGRANPGLQACNRAGPVNLGKR